MHVGKDFRFPVEVRWACGRIARMKAPGKVELSVAPPPELDGVDGVWTPEELLVSAVASCYVTTLHAIAERHLVPIRELAVRAVGHVTANELGRLRFEVIDLDVEFVTDEEHLDEAARIARWAEKRCLVSRALDVPVHVAVDVRSTALQPGVLAASTSE